MKWISRFVAVLTVAIALFASIFSVPRLAGINPYIILSGSMEPTIPTGSVVFINTKDRNVSENDVIAFQIGEEGNAVTVTHRAIEIKDGYITTKGDNNEYPDANPITEQNVVGTYMMHLPQAGYIISKLNQKQKIAIVIALLAANGVCFILENVLDDEEEEEAENAEDGKTA